MMTGRPVAWKGLTADAPWPGGAGPGQLARGWARARQLSPGAEVESRTAPGVLMKHKWDICVLEFSKPRKTQLCQEFLDYRRQSHPPARHRSAGTPELLLPTFFLRRGCSFSGPQETAGAGGRRKALLHGPESPWLLDTSAREGREAASGLCLLPILSEPGRAPLPPAPSACVVWEPREGAEPHVRGGARKPGFAQTCHLPPVRPRQVT